MIREGRGVAPALAQKQECDRIESGRAEQCHGDQARLAQRVFERVDQAAAAEVADDLEAHRVAEEGERLIFGDERPDRAAADEEGEVEMEERAVPLAAVQPADEPVEAEEDQALAGQHRGREGADLQRRVERSRLAEATAEQGVFALRQRELGEQGEEDRGRQGQPRRPSERQAPLQKRRRGDLGLHDARLAGRA